MIFRTLIKYYEVLERKEKITSPNWCRARVAYGLDISEQGELMGVIPLKKEQQNGKKTVWVPWDLTVPRMVSRSFGVPTNFPCGHSGCILGVDNKRKSERFGECFEYVKKKHKGIPGNISNSAAGAVCRFFDRWAPNRTAENPYLMPELGEIISGSNLVSMIDGEYTHEDLDIRWCWEEHSCQSGAKPESVRLVTRREKEIARIHNTIEGVQGAQPSGAVLVSFDAPTFESYGKEQSFNTPVDTYAVYAYTTALNYLPLDRSHETTIGNTAMVYWSGEGDERCQSIFTCMSKPTMENQGMVDGIFKNLVEGEAVVAQNIKDSLDMEKRPYILGLALNTARLAVRFFYQNNFGNILKHIREHYDGMGIVHPAANTTEYLGIWYVLQETVNKKSKDKEPVPDMSEAVYRSIMPDNRYSASPYQVVLGRIRAEQDSGDSCIYEITRGRATITKTYLLKNGNTKGEITMAFGEDSSNTAYILEREFAVLEVIQEDANPRINVTIKDKYSNPACVIPVTIFPILFRLKNSHMKKMNNGAKEAYYEKILCNLQRRLIMAGGQGAVCPRRFTPEGQGVFISGYYHQIQKRYERRIRKEA